MGMFDSFSSTGSKQEKAAQSAQRSSLIKLQQKDLRTAEADLKQLRAGLKSSRDPEADRQFIRDAEAVASTARHNLRWLNRR